MHRELAKFFKGGVFLCDLDSDGGDDDVTHQGGKYALLYLCQSHNHADTGYARSYFARRLREVVSVLAPGGHVYYDLDQDDEEGTKGLYGRRAAAATTRLGDEGGRLVRRLQALRGASPEIIERYASSRAIVEALYAMCAAIEGTSAGTSDVLEKTDDNSGSKECPVPTRAGFDSLSPSELITHNQRLSGSDAHVFLFVLPEQFQVAQALVDRWYKACEGHNTCFLYVKTSVVVVHAEEASTTDDSFSWQEDMRRNARPSLRSSLLMLDDAMERGSLADDLIVVLVGMQAALSFAAPGTQHSVLIPPVAYGGDSRYGLSTPVMFASRANSSGNSSSDEDCDPYAFAGAAWAVQIMLRSIRGQKEQSQYLHGDNTQVLGALRQYQRRHARWTSIDADSSIFNRAEGNRRWHYMTRPDALQVAKARALYLYAPNRNRTNNQYPQVIDIEDYSATANIDLVFNITYCELASAMAADKREYLPWFNEAGTAKTAAHAENATSGDPISTGRWLWARKERHKCSSNRALVLVLLWVGDIIGKHKTSEPLPPRYNDDYEHVKGEEGLVIAPSSAGGSDPQPVWFIEEQSGGLVYSLHQTVSETNGYTSIDNETAVHSSMAGPLSTFGQGVFAINMKSLPAFVSKIVDSMQQGMVMGSMVLSLQLHRAYSLTFDANRDTYLQDIVLLKLAELTKYLPHFRQYSPLESYKNAAYMLTEHMAGRDGFPHMGLSPYSAWNWQQVQRDAPPIIRQRSIHELELKLEDDDELDLNVRDKKNQERREGAESVPELRVNFTEYRRKQDTYGGKNKVSGEGRWGARGGSLASRLHSPITSVSLGPEEAPLILNLGEGRGPDTGTDVESYLSSMRMDSAHKARSSSDSDSGSGDVYWARAYESKHMQALSEEGNREDGAPTLDGPSGTGNPSFESLQEPGAHLGPAGAGREALGNPFAVASYSVLAGLYSSIGPYHASITAYAKSIAHADYFTVASRRRRWYEQQQRQQRLLALVDAANGGGAKAAEAAATLQRLEQSPDRATHHPFALHFVTMADRTSDKLSNLIFTAATSGVGLTVVGMKDEQSLDEDGATTKFNYADKVVAYYAHLSSGLRSGDIRPDDVVVFLDAYDVLLFPAARRIGRHLYHKSATPILFCAENGVYPEPASQYAHAYEGDDNGNGHPSRRYLNSGCIAGRAGQMFRMLQAAYDLRDSFRNDQQFYVKYALAHPDLVGLDRQSELFVTTHKGMSCRHTTVVSNALSLDYYFHPYSLACPTTTTGSVEERLSPDVGVLHANNLASNRVYHVVAQAYKQAVDSHMRGADGSLLLEAVWALADRRYGRAAALLTAPEVQRNFTSQGGNNLLGDLLLVRYGSELGPHFVQISEELGLCGGSAGATMSAPVPPPFRAAFDAQYGITTHSTEAELQCSYFAHLFLRESLSSVNAARFQAGVSPLAGGAHTSMCSRPDRDNNDDSVRSSSSCRSWRRELGSYGRGDQAALALLQLSMGGGRGDEYMWETTGALFEMQQRHLTDSLRVSVDGCA
jgi:hypothetical protein